MTQDPKGYSVCGAEIATPGAETPEPRRLTTAPSSARSRVSAAADREPPLLCLRSPVRDSQEPCQYSPEAQRFSCQLAVPEGDSSFYVVSLCVANSAGSESSSPLTFEGYDLRK